MKQEEVVKLNHKHCGRACRVLLYTGGTVPKRGNGDEKGVAHCKLFFSKICIWREQVEWVPHNLGLHPTLLLRLHDIFTRMGIGTLLVTKRLGQLGATKVCEHTRHLLVLKNIFWGINFLCVVDGFCVCVSEYLCTCGRFLFAWVLNTFCTHTSTVAHTLKLSTTHKYSTTDTHETKRWEKWHSF